MEFLSFKFGRHEAGKQTGQSHARINMKTVGYVVYHSNITMFLVTKHIEHVLRDRPQYGVKRALEGSTNIFSIF